MIGALAGGGKPPLAPSATAVNGAFG